jgi:hypothetical protein
MADLENGSSWIQGHTPAESGSTKLSSLLHVSRETDAISERGSQNETTSKVATHHVTWLARKNGLLLGAIQLSSHIQSPRTLDLQPRV